MMWNCFAWAWGGLLRDLLTGYSFGVHEFCAVLSQVRKRLHINTLTRYLAQYVTGKFTRSMNGWHT